MKFFLDENFPRKAAFILQAQGHEVFDIRGSKDEGKPDEWLFERAQRHEAVFLTTDKDFYHTIPAQYNKHFGAIVIALWQPNGPGILAKFETAMRFIQNFNLESNVILFTDNNVYTRTR